MKITIYEAIVDAGYAAPIFRSVNYDALIRKLAKSCREYWAGVMGDKSLPKSDESVVREYFGVKKSESLEDIDQTATEQEESPDDRDATPKLVIRSFEVYIGPPANQKIDLTVDEDCFEVELVRRETLSNRGGSKKVIDCGARSEGHLISQGEYESDILEGFVLSLTHAGFPVHHPEFKRVLREYCEFLSNKML